MLNALSYKKDYNIREHDINIIIYTELFSACPAFVYMPPVKNISYVYIFIPQRCTVQLLNLMCACVP